MLIHLGEHQENAHGDENDAVLLVVCTAQQPRQRGQDGEPAVEKDQMKGAVCDGAFHRPCCPLKKFCHTYNLLFGGQYTTNSDKTEVLLNY